MLTISNVYGHGFDAAQVSALEALGFALRPQVSTYAGTQICRFIDFERGPALELIEVGDQRDYLDFVPAGMQPYCPGISLLLPDGGTATLDDFEREFRHLDPYLLHVNYDSDSTSSGPGWNYLNFAVPIVPGTFTWLTALDQPKPAAQHETVHPNDVTGVVGLVFDLEPDALAGLARLVRADVVEGAFDIAGVRVWPRCALDDFPALGEKDFPLTAIILSAYSLDTFAAQGDRVTVTSFRSHPAILVKTNRLAWDLLVIED